MAKQDFIDSITNNDRLNAGDSAVKHVDVLIPQSLKHEYNWNKILGDFDRVEGKDWYRVGQLIQDGGDQHILMSWTTYAYKEGIKVNAESAGRHISINSGAYLHANLAVGVKAGYAKAGGLDPKVAAKNPNYQGPVGGHTQSQAYLQLLRKAVAIGDFPPAEAAKLARSLSHGFEIGQGPVGPQYQTGMIEEYTGVWGISDDLLKKVSAQAGVGYEYEREVLVPIPGTVNKAQFDEYEKQAIEWLEEYLTDWMDKQVDKPTSLPLLSQIAEVIAARLLGQKAKKYKDNHKVRTKRSYLTIKRRPIVLPKKDEAEGYHKRQSQIKTNPIALRALINKKLPQTITGNMGTPALESRSGRFASSVRLVNVLQNQNPVLQYTYQKRPYQVFEGTEPWAAGGERDPRELIDKSIREVAAGLMIGRFTTQRV